MLLRVAVPGKPAFQLRPGEAGLSVFDTEAVSLPLTESEVLDHFRPGSYVVTRSRDTIAQKGLQIVPIEAAAPLPQRLRQAHTEIRPGHGMSRREFKDRLKERE